MPGARGQGGELRSDLWNVPVFHHSLRGTIVNVPREPSTFAIDVPKVRVAIDQRTKVLFVASPEQPDRQYHTDG